MERIAIFFLVSFIALSSSSCLNRQFIDGRAELIAISDTTLNDSSIFVGHVHHIDWPYIFPGDYEIWIENTNQTTSNDSLGYYYLKTIPGTYSIKCQTKGTTWNRLVEEVSNVKIGKNKKIQIDFYIGYTIE